MKNRSKFIWVYSIALFSVAFILIGFSAFTGVRYQQTKTEERKLYQGAQMSVLELQDDLEELKRENMTLKETIVAREKTIEELTVVTKEGERLRALINVQTLLDNNRTSEAEAAFDAIDGTMLKDDALALYNKLKDKLK